MSRNPVRDSVLTILALIGVAIGLYFLGLHGATKLQQAFAMFAIWGIATVSLNLINGVTGILSLGHHGFMLVGGYVTALLILPAETRDGLQASARSSLSDFAVGLSVEGWLTNLGLEFLTTPETHGVRFVIALIIGGLIAAVVGIIVGFPSLRLRGDYLAIVTFAFGEAIRLLASTPMFSSFTNGALGFSGVPTEFGKSLWWTFGALAIAVFVLSRLKFSSYGRALMGIREDPVAVEAMGVNASYHKVLAFAISAFFAGIAGGLWVSWMGAARLDLFLFSLTFYFLVAISVGGTGSVTGALLGTGLVVAIRQYGDPLERSYTMGTWATVVMVLVAVVAVGVWLYRRTNRMRPTISPTVLAAIGLAVLIGGALLLFPNAEIFQSTWQGFGLRAIALAVILIGIMIMRPMGIMGRSEFTWAAVFRERLDQPTDEERGQDAWLTNPELADSLADPDPDEDDDEEDLDA